MTGRGPTWLAYGVQNIDFDEEVLVKESVRAAVASQGALSLDVLQALPWPHYEEALTELVEMVRKRENG